MRSEGLFKISELHLCIATVSEANCSEPWRKKHARHKLQKAHIRHSSNRIPKELPIHIKITRISPRTLDSHDNLPMSVKYISDQLAAEITGNHVAGRADDDKRITWEYDQVKGKPQGVLIEFFRKNAT